jgi:hypothetical protein
MKGLRWVNCLALQIKSPQNSVDGIRTRYYMINPQGWFTPSLRAFFIFLGCALLHEGRTFTRCLGIK